MDRVAAQLPSSSKGWSYLALAILFGAGLFILVIAAAQHLADDQFISNDELKYNVQQLESYSAEAAYLSQYTGSNASPRPYTEVYASSLQEASDSINQKLIEHPHSRTLDGKVSQTITMSQSLSDQLNQLGTEPTSQLSDMHRSFQNLADNFQELGQAL